MPNSSKVNFQTDRLLIIIFGEVKCQKITLKCSKKHKKQCVLLQENPTTQFFKIQKDFKEYGIEANITTGGLQVYRNHNNKSVKRICLKHNATPEPGVSRYHENAILNAKKTPFPTIDNP